MSENDDTDKIDIHWRTGYFWDKDGIKVWQKEKA